MMNFATEILTAMYVRQAPAFEPSAAWASEAVSHYGSVIMDKGITFAPRLVIAGLVVWIGSAIAGKIYRTVLSVTEKNPRIDTTLGSFVSTAVRYAMLAAVFLTAISILGFKVASIFVVLSAATLAIGLALQGSMANVAAGLLLVIMRPYKIGDYVEIAGEEGTVEDLNIFTTTLRTLDNIKVIVANGEVRGATIKNLTSLGIRRVDVDFGIDYNDDMNKAIKIITTTAGKHPDVLTNPDAPWAKVSCLNDSSVDIQMRVWCKAEHYWDVRFDLIKSVKEAFDEGGISIPYPHVVEMEQ